MITTYAVIYNPESAIPGKFYMNVIRLSDYKLWNGKRNDDVLVYTSPFRFFCEQFMKFCTGTVNSATHEEFVNEIDVALNKLNAVFAFDFFCAFIGNLFGVLHEDDFKTLKDSYSIDFN